MLDPPVVLSVGEQLTWAAALTFFGAYFGYRRDAIEAPCRVNQIPRQVPPQPWYMGGYVSALMGGVLPFGAIFIELYFIMNSIWFHKLYYVFGFLFVVVVRDVASLHCEENIRQHNCSVQLFKRALILVSFLWR